MSTGHLVVVIILAVVAGGIVGGALQVWIIRVALAPIAWDLERIAAKIAPELDED